MFALIKLLAIIFIHLYKSNKYVNSEFDVCLLLFY